MSRPNQCTSTNLLTYLPTCENSTRYVVKMEINKHVFFGTKKLHTLIVVVVAEILPPFTLKWVTVGAADAVLCAGGQRNCLNLLKAHF